MIPGSTTMCPTCRAACGEASERCESCGGARPDGGWPLDPLVGLVLGGKYRIDRRLAAGGFGAVLLGTHVHGDVELGRVVLKFMHKELVGRPGLVKRFVTEAKAARELTNVHVVRIFDLDFSDDGAPFMVQEYIAGEGLDVVIRREGRLDVPRGVRVAMQVAEAMEEAHAQGILHRDLKPENLRIMPTREGDFVKVLDFGIARVERVPGSGTCSFVGTPRYMSPEQITQRPVDARTDIFSLGVVLFEMLTGQPPIEAKEEMEYIHLNLLTEPRHARTLRPELPEALATLADRMMSKVPEHRPATMGDVYTALEAILSGWLPTPRSVGAAVAVRGSVRSIDVPVSFELPVEHLPKKPTVMTPTDVEEAASRRPRRAMPIAAAAAAVLLLLTGGAAVVSATSGTATPAPVVAAAPLEPAPIAAPPFVAHAPATAAAIPRGEVPPLAAVPPLPSPPRAEPRRSRSRPSAPAGFQKLERLDR